LSSPSSIRVLTWIGRRGGWFDTPNEDVLEDAGGERSDPPPKPGSSRREVHKQKNRPKLASLGRLLKPLPMPPP